MFPDQYLMHVKYRYVLKMADLLGRRLDRAYLEFAYGLLQIRELRDIIHGMARDLALTAEIINDLEDASGDAFHWAQTLEKILAQNSQAALSYKLVQRKILQKKLAKTPQKSEYQKNLEKFGEVFKLSHKELSILTFLYLEKIDDDIDLYFTRKQFDISNVAKNISLFCHFFEITTQELQESLSVKGVLMKAGIINKQKRSDSLQISETVLSYLSGFSKDSIEAQYVTEMKNQEILELEDHHQEQTHLTALTHLLSLKHSCQILLYGPAGTGKTEFARSLAKKVNKKVYFIHQANQEGEESLIFRKQALIAAHNIMQEEQVILVVDECDQILNINECRGRWESNRNSDRKAWINDFLENSRHKIIWISNRIEGIDESSKRRFSYSLEFRSLTLKQRQKAWETQVKKQEITFIGPQEISTLAQNLNVTPGGITLALRDVSAMKQLTTQKEKLQVLQTILTQNQNFTSDKEVGIIEKTCHYSLEVINSDYPLKELLIHTQNFLQEKLKFSQHGVFNLNILLHGPPGTGKTEFVKHMAQVTERELIIKKASDIKSKWYGESVQNIAHSFKEAQEKGSILFYDEADSFFSDRENAHHYQREETNEFLTQMENFKGILICATNLKGQLDPASMRRFNYKVKFDFLSNEAKASLFHLYFNSQLSSPVTVFHGERLKKMRYLTPGDFKVISQKNIFHGLKSADDFLAELEMEITYKKEARQKIRLT